MSGVKRELAELTGRFQHQVDDANAMRTLIEALPSPIWARDEAGKLIYVNAAYARAVDAKDAGEAIARGIELFDRAARTDLFRAHEAEQAFAGRLPAIVGGGRVMFDVLTFPTRRGSAGIGIDATEADAMRAELKRMVDAHRRTLDYLATGVAIFGADGRLTFYNTAFRSLWDLDAGFLDQSPSDSAMLDRLRDARRLPEQQDFRKWKAELHEAYRATEAKSHEWHLPDGRTLRVVTTPNPEGGVIYLYDDITEPLDLQRRFEALIRVQGETLDNLAEGVAVFASDGRLRLFNPVFAQMWKFDPAALQERPHIEAVIGWCHALAGDNPIWPALRMTVTAIDGREPVTGDIERRDGSVVKCATVPLPDGATLVTFQDITDSVNVERALRERNEALEDADKIKIDFVHHVSLRAALAAHQHHRLRAFPRRRHDRAAEREAARIPELHHDLDQRAARDHQQHPRSRHHRRRRDDAQSRQCRHPPDHGGRRRRRAGPPGADRHLARRSAPRPTSARSSPTSGACGRRCSTCWPTPSASRRRTAWSRWRRSGCRIPWCSWSPTRGRASRPTSRTRCSTGSRPTRSARATAAPAWASRWCARSSSCTAARSRSIPRSAAAPR